MYNVTATAMYRYRKKVGKWDIEFYVPQRDIKKKTDDDKNIEAYNSIGDT